MANIQNGKPAPQARDNSDVTRALEALIEQAGITEHRDLILDLFTTAIQLGTGPAERLDLKIAAGALRELSAAYDAFVPYRGQRKVAIFGSARTAPESDLYSLTRSFAEAISARGWMVMTGAGPGIMQAGLDGAGAEQTFGVGIRLPFEPVAPKELIGDPKMVTFRYFFARKLTFLRESSGIVALPGGFGTLDEVFETLTLLQTGKGVPLPVVLLDTPTGTFWEEWLDQGADRLQKYGYISSGDEHLFEIAHNIDDAVESITSFYSNYHSMRFVSGRLILRMSTAPDQAALDRLSDEFQDCIASGKLERVTASDAELRSHDVPELDRVALQFNRRHWVRLHQLIRRMNQLDPH